MPSRPAEPAATPAVPVAVGRAHQRRLREMYRSAGWPCQDALEVDLLAAGLLERLRDGHGRETLRVTDAGLLQIAEAQRRNRAARDAHEALVERVARAMIRAGRIAWRGLALRAKVGATPESAAWCMAMPDVFSIRNTTVEAYLEPVVHEVKVRRADLLADLKRETKRAGYLQLGGECWYVIAQGIARPEEIPPECGVLVAGADGALDVARPAPKRAATLPFPVWMALAKATPVEGGVDDEEQGWLGESPGP